MSSFALKLIAILTMTIDHLGVACYPSNVWFRVIGRIAMPIFAYQIAISYKKTSSKKKLILRLLLLAIVSQVPFMLLRLSHFCTTQPHSIKELISNPNFKLFDLNICFTFLIALLILLCIENIRQKKWTIFPALALMMTSIFLPIDYNWFGIALVIIFYFFGDFKLLYSAIMTLLGFLYCLNDSNWHTPIQLFQMLQMSMLLSLPFLFLYNNQKGKSLKYFFYVFYPLHMIIIAFIKFAFFC